MAEAVALALNVLWMAIELQMAGGRTGYDVQVYAQQISEDGWGRIGQVRVRWVSGACQVRVRCRPNYLVDHPT